MHEYNCLVSVSQLESLLGEPAVTIVDCRFDLLQPDQGRADFAAGHIPGAVYAHLDHELAAAVTPETGRHPLPTVATFEATLRRLGVRQAGQVVVYDGGPGALAARLWWMLRWVGHRQVAVLDGGMAAWQAAGLPVQQVAVPAPEGDFRARPEPGWVLGTSELSRRLEAAAAPVLVDARESARFRGEAEPIDSRAGHIPGALNFPFAQNIAADGCWRPAAELRADWQALLGDPPPAEWAVMCGSGVTACHLALSAELAGLPAPRLYAGSWSEWIRDPARPVAP